MNILFIVENDYFPRDARVLNEVRTLSEQGYNCFVVAPKQKNEKFFEKFESDISCYRFLHFESNSIILLSIEYINAIFWILIYTIYLTFFKGIRIIHVANPPDFIIPVLSFLKIFNIKFIFDIHDLSVETFNAKIKNGFKKKIIAGILKGFEKLSIVFSNAIICTNNSIKDYITSNYITKEITVVRNSNRIIYKNLEQVDKKENNICIIGYFGVLNADQASGLENILLIAKELKMKNFSFKFHIIGDGGGLNYLKRSVKNNNFEENFEFFGFIPLENSFEIIKNFDFGIVPWPDIPKNNFHTAMKVMDYMCCAVPICSLKLKEQIESTGNIGIHTNDFSEMANKIIEIYNDKKLYEDLRKRTLERFNNYLAWEFQSLNLILLYHKLLENGKKHI